MSGHLTWLAVMDAAVMVMIGVMIGFAVRLSRQLNAFREGRDELRGLIADLTGSVARAEAAITGLKTSGQTAGRDLQARIDAARALNEELQFVVEAQGNKDARRPPARRPDKTQADKRAAEKPNGKGLFYIRDRETEPPADTAFASQAERDLYEAMRGREKGGA